MSATHGRAQLTCQTVAELVRALDAHEAGNLAVLDRALGAGGSGSELEGVVVLVHQVAGDIDLLERVCC